MLTHQSILATFIVFPLGDPQLPRGRGRCW